MQPYFIPYAGYFRLFAATDLFVIYDCVQFTRRGWIHRNQLYDHNDVLQWLTLPFTKAPQTVSISELSFANDASARMSDQMQRFPIFNSSPYLTSHFTSLLFDFAQNPTSYICHLLKHVCETLGLPFNIAYSTDLNLPPEIKGQDRIINIAKQYGATEYVNLSGGRKLYETDVFKNHGMKLKFLSEYQGPSDSMLERLMRQNSSELRKDILTQSTIND